MNNALFIFAALSLCSAAVQAQVTPRRASIRAVGVASVSAKPDQAKITVGVVTQAATAQDASAQNATLVSAVLAQLRQVVGSAGDIKTINFSLNPNYNYPKDGGPTTLIGYTVSNTLEVTTSDLASLGKVIDTATQAGANQVQGVYFTLKDEQPARAQALRLAAIKARAQTDAIASGLGVRTGAIISAQEGVSYPLPMATANSAPSTPVVPGTLDVQATVTLEVEIAP